MPIPFNIPFRRKWPIGRCGLALISGTFTVFALSAACFAVGGDAGSCSLNRRTMSAVSMICSDTLCTRNLPTRIQVLGDKVLYYFDPADSTGLLYTSGKTVDLTPDWEALFRRTGSELQRPNEHSDIRGYALIENTRVLIDQTTKLIDNRTGTVLNTVEEKIVMGTRDCTSCEVMEYTQTIRSIPYSINETYHLAHQTCSFVK